MYNYTYEPRYGDYKDFDTIKAGAVLAKHSDSCILGHDGLAQSKYLMELFAAGYIGTGKRACIAGQTLPPILEAKKEKTHTGRFKRD